MMYSTYAYTFTKQAIFEVVSNNINFQKMLFFTRTMGYVSVTLLNTVFHNKRIPE